MNRENKSSMGGHLRNKGKKSWKWPWTSHEFLNYRSSGHPEPETGNINEKWIPGNENKTEIKTEDLGTKWTLCLEMETT